MLSLVSFGAFGVRGGRRVSESRVAPPAWRLQGGEFGEHVRGVRWKSPSTAADRYVIGSAGINWSPCSSPGPAARRGDGSDGSTTCIASEAPARFRAGTTALGYRRHRRYRSCIGKLAHRVDGCHEPLDATGPMHGRRPGCLPTGSQALQIQVAVVHNAVRSMYFCIKNLSS